VFSAYFIEPAMYDLWKKEENGVQFAWPGFTDRRGRVNRSTGSLISELGGTGGSLSRLFESFLGAFLFSPSWCSAHPRLVLCSFHLPS
jgi:hypothetical protein